MSKLPQPTQDLACPLALHGEITLAARKLVTGRHGVRLAGPLDFTLSSGEALIVTGANGIGKSTLLRTLAGLLTPVSGMTTIVGATNADGEAAESIGEVAHYVGHRNAMKPGMSVFANLGFWMRFLQERTDSAQAIDDALEKVGLTDLVDLPFGYLSAGQQRRASLARLLVAPRPVWILDEPTSALDMHAQGIFAALVSQHLSDGGIAIAATHQPLGLAGTRDLHLKREASQASEGEDDDVLLQAAEGWL